MEAYELPKADSERIAEELEDGLLDTGGLSEETYHRPTTVVDMKANQLAQIASLTGRSSTTFRRRSRRCGHWRSAAST